MDELYIAFTSPQGSTRDSYVAIFLVFFCMYQIEKLALPIWYHQSGCVYRLPALSEEDRDRFQNFANTRTKDERDRKKRIDATDDRWEECKIYSLHKSLYIYTSHITKRMKKKKQKN